MPYVLVLDSPHTKHVFEGAQVVEICPEDGTVYSASVLMCPTCSLRPDPRWGG